MPSSMQNDRTEKRSGSSFDTGASAAMSNVEFSSSIYESPNSAGSDESTRMSQPTSLAGEPISKQAVVGSGTVGKAQEAQPKDNQGSKQPKDTAGAGAMIL